MFLGYDKKQIEFNIDEKRLLGVLTPNRLEHLSTGMEEVKRSLLNPIGKERLKDLVKKNEKICIITSDITRPCPSKVVIPPIIEELKLAGVESKDITIVFALGSHRHHTTDEMKYMVGEEIYNTVRCIDSDPDKCIHLGDTKEGTPVDIFDEVANSDFIICVGNIEYHYFAGYSGGAKAIMPGVSTPKAIQSNHRMMVLDTACAGNINSPVRKDIEEAVTFLGIDYIVNVVLDEHKNVVYSVAGDYIKAHRKGCEYLDKMYSVEIEKQADIVIVTPGGYPKDQNMYQAQKALDNAKHAVKKGGIIIWLASCKEGLGSVPFERWMTTKKPKEMIRDIKLNFELGGHKAAAIALVLENARIFLVSDLDASFVKSINLEPYPSLMDAFDAATEILGKDSKVLVMPYGGSTLPKLLEK